VSSSQQTDRIAGVLVGQAAGDALGAGYEFGPAFDGPVRMKGGGPFGWEPGEWTDDTQMAICIAEGLASDGVNLAKIGDRFIEWSKDARDVGVQTRAVLSAASNGARLHDVAQEYAASHPKGSAGNGSLMRTGPVALAHLDSAAQIANTASSISALTHADPLAGEACILWSVAIANAIATGTIPDFRMGLAHLRHDRRPLWTSIVAAAETADPRSFNPNGFVVPAFQAAWSSIVQTPVPRDRGKHLRLVLENTVRIGHDTDTTAAIAGSMLGAIYGASAVPREWADALHGWPSSTANDLASLAMAITERSTR